MSVLEMDVPHLLVSICWDDNGRRLDRVVVSKRVF